MKRYYEAGGSRIGMRQGSTLYWLVSDHLGSTSVTANASGGLYGRLLYKAWGEQRWSSGTTPTTYRYTGQRSESSLGLYYYGARWYDPYIAQFTQPDTLIPNPYNPLDWNRYAYARSNPLKLHRSHRQFPLDFDPLPDLYRNNPRGHRTLRGRSNHCSNRRCGSTDCRSSRLVLYRGRLSEWGIVATQISIGDAPTREWRTRRCR